MERSSLQLYVDGWDGVRLDGWDGVRLDGWNGFHRSQFSLKAPPVLINVLAEIATTNGEKSNNI